MLVISLLLSGGCKSNVNNISEKIENSEFEDSAVKISDSNTSDMYYSYSDFINDDFFYDINDVKYTDNKIYVSGFVISDNNESPVLINHSSSANTGCEYNLEKNEQFYYYNDVMYTFKSVDDMVSIVNILDAQLNLSASADISQYNVCGINSVSVCDNTVDILDKESVLHRFEDDFSIHTEKDVSEYLHSSYRIFADKQKNIYIFTADNDETVLYKLDSEFNLIYKSGSYSDMPGSVFDIFIENDKLNIQTIDEGYVYTNVIDESSGETIFREDVYLYEKKDNDQITDISENETYIGTNSDGSSIILQYPEIQEYYCTLVKDENGDTIEERKFVTEQSKIISQTEICGNGDTLYIEESYDIKEQMNENAETPEHIIHRIKEDGTHSSVSIPVYNTERYPLAIKTDSKGNIYVIENKENYYQISCYSEQGELIYQTEESKNILSFLNTLIVNDELYINYMSYDEKYVVQKISSDGDFKEKEENPLFTKIYSGNDQYDLFTTDGKKVYGYNIGTYEFSEILSLISCGIQFTPSDFFEYKNDFVISDEKSYYLLTEDESSSSRQIIKLSGIEISSEIKAQVVNFNNANDKYIIECVDYNMDEDSFNKLNIDIISKKTDVVVFNNYSPLRAENYNSFLFADLSEYISDDSDIDEDNYFSGIINLFRSEDKLYTMVTEFNIYTMIKRNGNNVNGLSLNLNDFLKENSKMNEYRFGLASNIFSSYIKDRDFVNNDFRSVLKYLKENVYDIGEGSKHNFAYVEFSEENDDEYYGCLMTPHLFQKDLSVSYSGFPSTNGIGIVAESLENFSILDNSENKDGAWEFIKYCLSDDYQNSLYRGIPVKKSAYDKAFTGEKNEKERCLNVINSADCKYIGDTDLFNIIWEESVLYFNDERTLDETVDSIKKKTGLYLSETNPAVF